MGFWEAVSSVFRKYAVFNGRARRSEFWYFYLFNSIVYSALLVLSYIIFFAGVGARSVRSLNAGLSGFVFIYILFLIYAMGTLIPTLAVGCRRLHDINRAGVFLLFMLIPLVGWVFILVWALQEGDHGPNRFGPDPKGAGAVAVPVREHRQDPRPASGDKHDSVVRNTPHAPEKPTACLEGVSGSFEGRRLPIRGTIVAGRHPDCGIRFPQDTRGVSHRHCQFSIKGTSFTVTDTGSSCGTFVNEKRLLPNQPAVLSRGDMVWLGSRKQSFRVM